MRYCLLTYDEDDSRDFKRVANYELGSFDLVSFWETARLDGLDLASLRLRIEGEEQSDYLAGPLTLPLVSDSFANYIAGWSEALRFSPVPESVCTPNLEGFYVLECINKTAPSDHVWISHGENPYRIFFSEECAKGVRDLGLQGMAFICKEKLSDFVPPVLASVR